MPKQFRTFGSDQKTILLRATLACEAAVRSLQLAKEQVYPEAISDEIIGFATREAIKTLNTVRREWGLDEVAPEECGAPNSPLDQWRDGIQKIPAYDTVQIQCPTCGCSSIRELTAPHHVKRNGYQLFGCRSLRCEAIWYQKIGAKAVERPAPVVELEESLPVFTAVQIDCPSCHSPNIKLMHGATPPSFTRHMCFDCSKVWYQQIGAEAVEPATTDLDAGTKAALARAAAKE